MTRQLKEYERLIRAGNIPFHAPDGTPLPGVPQYRIVNADEVDPAAVVELKENERLILAGREFNDMKLARERFAAYKSGRKIPPRDEGIPFYIIVSAEEVNPKTSNTHEFDEALRAFGKEIAFDLFSHIRKTKAAVQLNERSKNTSDHTEDLGQAED